uniref:Deacetylase sirtuin-type domain-containing protein n=1 Tax=Ganoderma boninense TaxID=34458 RepID=A0A5K1K322_9APHY|nr:Uncharacterized protein [Ganoderma boninense]
MTTFLPLDATTVIPVFPSFLKLSPDPEGHVKRVVMAILKARKIVVVCGAGISVQAGIPDFRSSEGLFQSTKKNHPTLVSGKDLFDASVFNYKRTTSLFCQMIAKLSQLSEDAEPTAFHRLLGALDGRGSLMRVYTQNIDALETKAGLSFGLPEWGGKRSSPMGHHRCIPLHGTLQWMHCATCTHSYPLRDFLSSLVSGQLPLCPQCVALEETRRLVAKRSRGVGKLRPSLVLYNEDHRDAEIVGHIVEKDLMGKRSAAPDLLLVVGTSLQVPGTRRIVREFSKVVQCRYSAPTNTSPMASSIEEPTKSAHDQGRTTPTPSSSVPGELPVRAIYLNLDFPGPSREWEGVFDVWIQGDAQQFARLAQEELENQKKTQETMLVKGRKRRRRRQGSATDEIKKRKEFVPPHDSAVVTGGRSSSSSVTLESCVG